NTSILPENIVGQSLSVGFRPLPQTTPGTPFARGHRQRPGYVDLRVNSVSDLLLRRRPLRG
ncbi:hypothetical protein WLY07_16700, partial [Bordetella bronchiseptica]